MSSEVVSRHCRGKSVTSVRLQRETLTPSPRAASQDHISLQTLHSKAAVSYFDQYCPANGFMCVVLQIYPSMYVCCNDCVNRFHGVIFIQSLNRSEMRGDFLSAATLLCCGVYLSFCRLVLL